MSNNFKSKKHSVKKSSGGQSKELLKTLQKIIFEKAGSVSYIFIDERIENIHSNKPKELNTIQKKATLHVNLNEMSLTDKSPNQLVHMFETVKHDLGANYFIVNSL